MRDSLPVMRASRWSDHVVQNVEAHLKSHPTFCIEELQDYLRVQHPKLRNTFEATILQALKFDMMLTRKKLIKVAREATPE